MTSHLQQHIPVVRDCLSSSRKYFTQFCIRFARCVGRNSILFAVQVMNYDVAAISKDKTLQCTNSDAVAREPSVLLSTTPTCDTNATY